MWWCQIIDWLKFETRPSSLLNFGTAYVINASRTFTVLNNFGSVSVLVFVVKEAFDLPFLLQDYKDKIEISELEF